MLHDHGHCTPSIVRHTQGSMKYHVTAQLFQQHVTSHAIGGPHYTILVVEPFYAIYFSPISFTHT